MADREWSWPGITESERRAVRFAMSHRDEYEDRGPDSCIFGAAFAESEINLAFDALAKDVEGRCSNYRTRSNWYGTDEAAHKLRECESLLALIAKHRPGGE